MQLSAEMRRAVEQEQLGFVATVRPDGTPALSPKGTTSVWTDSQLVFLHIHSEGTVANLVVNPAIEISVVDPIGRHLSSRSPVRLDGVSVNRGRCPGEERMA